MGVSLSNLPDLELEKGMLEDTPLAFLLGAAKVWEVTGVLTIERKKAHKQVFFLQGLPVYCKSDLTGESLRQVLYKAGKIDHQTLLKVQELMEQKHVEEDRALLELGVFDESTRYFRLQEQARKRILSSFAWADGRYTFEPSEEFLDRVDLLDIDPLEVIHEGMVTHHVLDLAGIMQEAASETVIASENIGDFEPFVKRFYPEAKPVWSDGGEMLLGNVLAQLHPDITKSLNLTFILLAVGGLLIGDKRPGELQPPPAIESPQGEELVEDAGELAWDSEDLSADPWSGQVESPSLDDEDSRIPEVAPEEPAAKKAPKGPPRPPPGSRFKVRKKPSAKPTSSRPRKKGPPPAEPPWKRRARETREARKQRGTSKAAAAGVTDPDIEKRYNKILDMVRRGNPFEILGVGVETQRAEIKKAYFQLHTQCRPDKMDSPDPSGEHIINEIQDGLRNACDLLLDPDRRHEYESSIFVDEKNKAWSIDLKKQLAKKQWLRGKWYLSHRRPDLALTFFDRAVNLDTEQAPYYAFLAWAQYASRRGNAAACKAFLRTAFGINRKLPETYLFMGWILKDIGEEKEAIECFERTLEYDSRNTFAKQELGKSGPSKKKSGDSGLIEKIFRK